MSKAKSSKVRAHVELIFMVPPKLHAGQTCNSVCRWLSSKGVFGGNRQSTRKWAGYYFVSGKCQRESGLIPFRRCTNLRAANTGHTTDTPSTAIDGCSLDSVRAYRRCSIPFRSHENTPAGLRRHKPIGWMNSVAIYTAGSECG